jgi:hypothetical protein
MATLRDWAVYYQARRVEESIRRQPGRVPVRRLLPAACPAQQDQRPDPAAPRPLLRVVKEGRRV